MTILAVTVGDFTSLPGFDLFLHGVEIALHPIDAYRDAIDERERLRVFREHGGEHARDNVAKRKLSTALTCDPFHPRTSPANSSSVPPAIQITITSRTHAS